MIDYISPKETTLVRRVEDKLFFLGEVMLDNRGDGIIRNRARLREFAKNMFHENFDRLLEFNNQAEASSSLQGLIEYYLKEYYRITMGILR